MRTRTKYTHHAPFVASILYEHYELRCARVSGAMLNKDQHATEAGSNSSSSSSSEFVSVLCVCVHSFTFAFAQTPCAAHHASRVPNIYYISHVCINRNMLHKHNTTTDNTERERESLRLLFCAGGERAMFQGFCMHRAAHLTTSHHSHGRIAAPADGVVLLFRELPNPGKTSGNPERGFYTKEIPVVIDSFSRLHSFEINIHVLFFFSNRTFVFLFHKPLNYIVSDIKLRVNLSVR